MNFRPPNDYQKAIADIRQPTQVLVGEEDEVFIAEAFRRVFHQANPGIGVRIVPELNHIGLTLDDRGIRATLSAVRQLSEGPSGARAPCSFPY